MKMKTILAGCVVTAALVGCGGGGGGSSTTPVPVAPSMEGYWSSTETSETQAYGIVTGTDAWVIDKDLNWFARAEVTTSTANGTNSFASVDDNSFRYTLASDGTTATGTKVLIEGTYIPKESLSGADFQMVYDNAFETPASLASASGAWTGSYGGGANQLVLTISDTTLATGISTTGCSYTGTLTPHTTDAVFDLTVTESCVDDTETEMSGIAFLMNDSQILVLAATGISDKTKGAFFVGNKQPVTK
jgi:hypothetical protein